MLASIKYLLCAYYSPGIHTIETLLSLGCKPGHIALLTHNDRRNKTLINFAKAHKIPIKSTSIKDAETQEWILAFNPDIILSTYFRHIIPQAILDIPRFGGINIHPSLLPKYKGTFSIPWAIINGESQTGFTYHFMTAGIDEGNIILQKALPIKQTDTAYSLYHKIIIESAKELFTVLDLVVNQEYAGEPQTEPGEYFKREIPFNGYINTTWELEKIERFIRAMYFPPFKSATLAINKHDIEIFSIEEYKKAISQALF